jgi:hypothetical protein
VSEIGEAVKKSGLGKLDRGCPFKQPPPPKDPSEEDEDYAWDDRISMPSAQANNGGTLGRNVKSGRPGAAGTWNVLGGDPDRYKVKQVDTARTGGREIVKVRRKNFPFTVAAHHLIPGEASLHKSQLYKSYMKRGGKMEIDTPRKGLLTFVVSHNIGYNVNGSHNGVWLPGSYAIVAGGNHPQGLGWQELNSVKGDIAWCYEYMAAVAKKVGGQFHDSHDHYNKNALKVLEEQTAKLSAHQPGCDICKKADKLPPPYQIKAKLYRLSSYLRTKTLGGPAGWKLAWFTSDQVRTDIFGDKKKRAAFKKLYRQSQ